MQRWGEVLNAQAVSGGVELGGQRCVAGIRGRAGGGGEGRAGGERGCGWACGGGEDGVISRAQAKAAGKGSQVVIAERVPGDIRAVCWGVCGGAGGDEGRAGSVWGAGGGWEGGEEVCTANSTW